MTAMQRLAIIDRGEPAMRCISAVAELNRESREHITTIALYTQDTASWIVREASEAMVLSPATFAGTGSYHSTRLDPVRLLAVLTAARADTLWAGWEFIAEPAELVRLCEREGITFIGPGSEVIRLLGDKTRTRQLAESLGVPVAPWPAGPAGESASAPCGPAARHVEVQVVADGFGAVWAVGVSDCSIRRRNQPVIVESACTPLDETGEQALRDAAIRLCSAVGYRGTGSAEFLVDPATRQFLFTDFRIQSLSGHLVTELTTGLDLAKLQLDIARGGQLSGSPAPARGHAIEVGLAAEDLAFAPAPGRVAALRPPSGAGIRVDVGVGEGDEITAGPGSVIATVAAWGRDRREALSRLHRGLAQSIVVIDGGTTNKALLLTLIDRPEIGAGRYDRGWLDRLTAAGEHLAPQHPVALLQGAIEAVGSDQAAVQAAFFAAAARGRPELPAETGHQVELSLRGNLYRMHVYCLGSGCYRVDTGDGVIDANVQHLGRYERVVTCFGRRHRVVAGVQGPRLIVEVDGVPHVITRHGGSRVRAPAPAFVAAVQVAPGDAVRAGDPLVVVESMKMETAITAPFSGTIGAILASVNTHVEAGTPLVQLQPADEPGSQTATGPRLSFAAAPDQGSQGDDDFAALRSYLLGYDIGDDAARELGSRREAMPDAVNSADSGLFREEQELLEIFADITALARREPDEPEDEYSRSPEDYLFTYLTSLDPSGLPGHFLDQLRDTLARYGVRSLRRTPKLEQALPRIYRSVTRVQHAAPVVMAMLSRWLRRCDTLTALMTDERLTVLDRLIASTQQRHQDVCDLARDVRFSYVDAPLLRHTRTQVYAEMESCLDELEAHPSDKFTALTDRLVWCPLPMRALLRDRYGAADATTKARLLQVRARRFYRIRELRQLRCQAFGPHLACLARYAENGRQVQLVHGYVSLDDLADFASQLQPFLGALPPDQRVVVDLESWRSGGWLDAGSMAAELAGLLARTDFGRPLHRLDITVTNASRPAGAGQAAEHLRTQHFTYRQGEAGFSEDPLYRNMHPMIAERLDLWRLSNFGLQRLSSAEDVYLFHAVAKQNPKDQRLIAIAEVRDLTPARDSAGHVIGFPHLEAMLTQAFADIRHALGRQPAERRPPSSRVILYVRPTWEIAPGAWRDVAHRLAPIARGLGLEKITVRIRTPDQADGGGHDAVLDVENVTERAVTVRARPLSDRPIQPLTEYKQKLLRSQRLGVPYPYELIRMLTPPRGAAADFPAGEFAEYDLEDSGEQLIPVSRPYGHNRGGIVVGVITSYTVLVPGGLRRVAILSDPTSGLGNLAEAECRRILAALALARQLGLPVEWFALSSGARIAWDSGTENMDWIAAVLRRLIEFTQAGGEVNVVVTGINVGGQPYWNAAATMLMGTRGILVMTPASAMVLTGKSSLEYSGGVSAEDNFGIGGFDRIMGPNGQGQYWAPTLAEACALLLRHYEHAYIVPGESGPRRAPTSDPFDRDVCGSPLQAVAGSDLSRVGDIFSAELNGKRKKPFFMRSLMRAVTDTDHEPFERWARWRDGENAIVWEAHVGGIPVCLIGFESHTRPRTGFIPADGPPSWTSGTLFPQAARKVARAVNAASGNRPVVILANLSGFDGSPESMRTWELEYGAEIGGAVTNFRGPIVLVVVSRYHGGAFVVFSKRLHEDMETAAVAGSYASVIGGAPAAATVFAREVNARTENDPRVTGIRARLAADPAGAQAELRHELADTVRVVRAETLRKVADEFDSVHDIRRALRVGSVDHIIPAAELRPFIIGALERRLATGAAHTAVAGSWKLHGDIGPG